MPCPYKLHTFSLLHVAGLYGEDMRLECAMSTALAYCMGLKGAPSS